MATAAQTVPIEHLEAEVLAVENATSGSQIAQYERDALVLADEAKKINITDQLSYEQAVVKGNQLAGFLKGWMSFIERPYDVVFSAYKSILSVKKVIEGPTTEAKTHLAREIQRWDREQEEQRRAEQARIEAEQRRVEQEQKLNAATQAEQAGASEQAVEQILSAPSVAPRPVAAPTYQKSTAASVRENWAGEVVDFHALVKAAAKRKDWLALLSINQVALNAQAKTHKAALADVIPGVRGVNKGSVAFRGK
ncbi:MAG: hypothetical protein ACREF8_02890 [Chthoniobacterales bacterium]